MTSTDVIGGERNKKGTEDENLYFPTANKDLILSKRMESLIQDRRY